ncbi:MAG: trypsin-like peptidase domain-containing protein [Bacteroidales bacterium]|nr:trypsin-like peptidase domain-containing protein [Bacteroidales bacterium]
MKISIFVTILCLYSISLGEIQAQRNRTLVSYHTEYKTNPEQFLKTYPHAPQWEAVGKTSFGTCIIRTLGGTGSGFLVTPKHIVTNAHVVGTTQASGISASFCYFSTDNTNNPYYVEKSIKSVEMNPSVKTFLQNGGNSDLLNPALDWAVLELNTPFTTDESKRRILNIVPGIYKKDGWVLDRPFILHHGAGSPMKISYVEFDRDVAQQNGIKINAFSYLFPNCLIAIEGGSSGAAFCDNDGTVLGVVVAQYNSMCSAIGETGSPLMWLLPFDVLLDEKHGSTALKTALKRPNGYCILNQNISVEMPDKYTRNSSDGTSSPFVAEIKWRDKGSIVVSIGSKNTVSTNSSFQNSIEDIWAKNNGISEFGVNLSNYNFKVNGKQAICFGDLFPNNGQGRYKFTVNAGGSMQVSGHPDIQQYTPNGIFLKVWLADKNLKKIRDLSDIDLFSPHFSVTKNYDIILSEAEPALETYVIFELDNSCYTEEEVVNSELVDVQVCQQTGINISNVEWSPTDGWLKTQSVGLSGGNYQISITKATNNPNFAYYILKSLYLCRSEKGANCYTDDLGTDHEHCFGNAAKHKMEYIYQADHFYGTVTDAFGEKYNHGEHAECSHKTLFWCDGWRNTQAPCRQYTIKSAVISYETYNSNDAQIGNGNLVINLPYEAPTITSFNSGQQYSYANQGMSTAFTINSTGNCVSYDWFENSQIIKSGKENFLQLLSPSIADDGKQYWCRVVNPRGAINSQVITLKISDYPYPEKEDVRMNRVTVSTGMDAYFPVIYKRTSNSFTINWGDGRPNTQGTHDFTKACRKNNSCYWQSFVHQYTKPGKYTILVSTDGGIPVSKNIVVTKADITSIINLLLTD